MPKFRKKPVVIEAIQYMGEPFEYFKVLEFVGKALCPYQMNPGSKNLHIKTLEGLMTVSPTDWIIKGISGEFYPCKNDIFLKTYDAVEEE